MKTKLLRALASAGVCFALTFLLSSARFPFGISPFYLGAYLSLLAMGGNFFPLSAAFLLARYLSDLKVVTLLQAAFAAAGAGVFRLIPLLVRKRFYPVYTVLSAFSAEQLTLLFLRGQNPFLFLGNSALACLFALLCTLLVRRGRCFRCFGRELPLTILLAFVFGAGSYALKGFGLSPYFFLLSAILPLSVLIGAEGVVIPLAFAVGGAAVSGDSAVAAAAPAGAAEEEIWFTPITPPTATFISFVWLL